MHELTSLPPVDFIDSDLLHQPVSTQLWQQLCPNRPVKTAEAKDTPGNNIVSPVWHALVDILAVLGRGVRCKHEEEVAEEEKEDDRESGFERWTPAPRGAVDVEVDETDGDECVDNS